MPDTPESFPHAPRSAWWVPAGGVLLALLYLPTVSAPFDFTDDGNLVYPAPAGTTLAEHAGRYADKVRANVDHLGPFRPVLWLHWEVFANAFGGDPLPWRVMRLVWCGLAATALLALLRSLNVRALPALLAGLAAMANPYRNEIWTSLTLAEGVAMPYCLLALWAARRAASSPRPGKFDLAAVVCFVAALGCKNTFAALAPALVALRVLPDGVPALAGVRANGRRALVLLAPLLIPAVHFVYFKLNWKPGQYETPGPSAAQFGKMLSWLKGAAGADFLGVGVVLTLAAVWYYRRRRVVRPAFDVPCVGHYRALLACAGCLGACGVAVYLPLPMMAARYTMPAVWGADLLFALLMTAGLALPPGWPKRVAVAAVVAGLAGLAAANVGRQEKTAARSRLLWDAVRHVEQAAPPGARVEWVGGDTSAASLNTEEGIHFRWHLLHRGRADVRVALADAAGTPVVRVELSPPDGPPDFRVTMAPGESGVRFERAYWLGRKRLACRVEPVRPDSPGLSDADMLARLAATKPAGGPATAARR